MVYFFFAELTRKILQGNRINEVLNYGSSESVPTTLKCFEKQTPVSAKLTGVYFFGCPVELEPTTFSARPQDACKARTTSRVANVL